MAFNSYVIIHVANNVYFDSNFEHACVAKDRGFICNAWLQ